MNAPLRYLTAKQVGELAQRHEVTVRDACRAGELHGVQQHGKNSNWRIKESCAEAWIERRLCEHKQNVTKIRKAS